MTALLKILLGYGVALAVVDVVIAVFLIVWIVCMLRRDSNGK